MKPSRTCPVPGCPAYQPCPTHKRDARTRDPGDQRFYNSTAWKKVRAIVRANHPICQECKRRPTQTVDHVDPEGPKLDPANLQGLCWSCHNTKSGREHRRKRST